MVVKTHDSKYFFRIVWIKELKNIGCLVHELFHLVIRIMADKGIPVVANIQTGECGDETAAYLLEFYLNECLNKIFKKNNNPDFKDNKK